MRNADPGVPGRHGYRGSGRAVHSGTAPGRRINLRRLPA